MKRWLLKKVVKHLYNGLTEDDLLVYNKGKLRDDEVKSLAQDAKAIKTYTLWDRLMTEIEIKSLLKLPNAKSQEDVVFIRASILTVRMIRNEIEKLSKIK